MLTVLFATRNGAATLPRVLEAYTRLQSPEGSWKLVVVDNGSTDTSRQLIHGFERRLPLSYVFEPRAGKNASLNAGLCLVSGDLVVLTDDDTFPKQDWLIRLRHAADVNPTIDIFGGAVIPRWEVVPPSSHLTWVPLAWTYTITNPNLLEGPIDGREVFGPNMAVRTSIFNAGYRFDPSIGPNGSRTYVMGSETEFVLRVMARGARALHVPNAVVEHFVPAAHTRRSWIIRRAVRAGRCEARLYLLRRFQNQPVWAFQRPPRLTPRCFGLPLSLVYQLARKTVAVVAAVPLMNEVKLFRSLWFLAFMYGFTCEMRDATGRSSTPNGQQS